MRYTEETTTAAMPQTVATQEAQLPVLARIYVGTVIAAGALVLLYCIVHVHVTQWALFLSLIVILAVRELVFRNNIDAWNNWGWRIPFLLSAFLVAISLFIRLRLRESPLFAHLKTTGRSSKPSRWAISETVRLGTRARR